MNTQIRSYADGDFDGVAALWREAFPDDAPRNRAEAAIPIKLSFQPDTLLVAVEGEHVIGTVMAGFDGYRGWLNRVAVLTSHRRRGVGAGLVREAERRLKALGCAKINLQVRGQNAVVAAFYQSLGYGVEDRISMGKNVE
jgi:ribosomal protein S18 acetylase RimI-like enzyme